jgi:hypothetical protein
VNVTGNYRGMFAASCRELQAGSLRSPATALALNSFPRDACVP